jgi:coiled-coil domain-containing protein 12
MSEKSVGGLANEALQRKERLNALKRGDIKTLKHSNINKDHQIKNKDEDNQEIYSILTPLFRNYSPIDDELQTRVLPKPLLIDIENEIRDQLKNSKAKPLIEKEIDLNNLAPQKIDWDLKRFLEKKLKLLEKQTQRAIVELINERLKNNEIVRVINTLEPENNLDFEHKPEEKNETNKYDYVINSNSLTGIDSISDEEF